MEEYILFLQADLLYFREFLASVLLHFTNELKASPLDAKKSVPAFQQELKAVEDAVIRIYEKRNNQYAERLKECMAVNDRIIDLHRNVGIFLAELNRFSKPVREDIQVLAQREGKDVAVEVALAPKLTSYTGDEFSRFPQYKRQVARGESFLQNFSEGISQREIRYSKLVNAAWHEANTPKYSLARMPANPSQMEVKPFTIYVRAGYSSLTGFDSLECIMFDKNYAVGGTPISIDGHTHSDKPGRWPRENEFAAIIQKLQDAKGDVQAIESDLPVILEKFVENKVIPKKPAKLIAEHRTELQDDSREMRQLFAPDAKMAAQMAADVAKLKDVAKQPPSMGIVYLDHAGCDSKVIFDEKLDMNRWNMKLYTTLYAMPTDDVFNYLHPMAMGVPIAKLTPIPELQIHARRYVLAGGFKQYQFLYQLRIARPAAGKVPEVTDIVEVNSMYEPYCLIHLSMLQQWLRK